MLLRIIFCVLFVLGVFSAKKLFEQIGSWHSKKILEEQFDYFRENEVEVSALNYFRGDFLILRRPDLQWTFNRYSGDLVPWGSREMRIQLKKKGKP